MPNILNLGLRSLQLVLTIITMALIGNVIQTAFAGNPSVINYSMATAAFVLFCLIFFFVAEFIESVVVHAFLPALLDLLCLFFTFCAAVALAAELGVHSCSNNDYTSHNHLTNGANNRKARCQEEQAACAFLWFLFASFLATLALSALASRGGANMRSGGIRRGPVPSMSQA